MIAAASAITLAALACKLEPAERGGLEGAVPDDVGLDGVCGAVKLA